MDAKETFKKAIMAYFKKHSGMSVTAAKKKIRSEFVVDKWGNTQNYYIMAGNVKLMYVHNENFANGIKNGYGRGWYISNQGFMGGSIVKLSSKF